MLTVIESPEFIKQAQGELSSSELEALKEHIATTPKAGAVIQGTGGIRKLRWGRRADGKSGGLRTIYFYCNDSLPVYLVTMYPKSAKDTLTKAEKNELSKFTVILKTALEANNVRRKKRI
ncbi:MAG: type II toxin-antitoxin system RelE/ParE family toxin [Pseudomonadales bacterium]|nr:type II toxin-antitoxin system RelE/ParE family toxin [Pseudomonadales bacterium]